MTILWRYKIFANSVLIMHGLYVALYVVVKGLYTYNLFM
jgi:hypothetical protein